MNKLLKAVLPLVLAMVVAVCFAVPAFAAESDSKGSISISSDEINSEDITIIKVADAVLDNGDWSFELLDKFKNCDVDINNMEDASVTASKLYTAYMAGSYVGQNPTYANGVHTFSGLDKGVYLISQVNLEVGKPQMAPFIVTVPMTEEDRTEIMDIDATPKVDIYEQDDVTVKKLWNDGEGKNRPKTVTVSLYRNGAKVDTVKLSEDNDWTYTWHNISKDDRYEVVEESNTDYTDTYSKNGKTLTITNNAKTLPQTGQLNWPIPVLAICGVIIFALGWCIVFLTRRKHG